MSQDSKSNGNCTGVSRARYGYWPWFWGVVVPLILTLLDWLFRQWLTSSNILMFDLLGVFFVAIRFGFWPSILASLINAASFAFFFAPPIFSFAIADRENLAGLAVTILVGAVTSKLAQTIRFQKREAEQREHRASALYRLSKELAEAQLESEIVEIGVRHVYSEFGSRNTLLFPDHNGLIGYPGEPPLEISLQGADLDRAQSAFQKGQITGYGTDPVANVTALYVPLNGSTGPLGVLALEAVDLPQISAPEQRQLLDTFLNQIVHTLERARLAEQAQDATLKIEAETLRNSLLSSISHDLRTPLATIVTAATTLEADGERLDDAHRKKLVAAISEEAQRMSDLTTKILAMARLEAGEVVLNRQWYAPEEIIGSALRRLDKRLKGRSINLNMKDGQALIYVDAVLLQQVLVNLLDNADKYSPAGLPIDIELQTTPLGLFISIVDRGAGVPDSMQQKIFNKFFRVHAETAQSGVGLGLSICRSIVEAHGGMIEMSNRDGGGAVFKLRLPIPEHAPTITPEERG
ncbi:DUF4118 domain-containing protein [Methylococcus mesophilus]|nr:DUF4118 domain-containing protein [Methylococcus mesophilus]